MYLLKFPTELDFLRLQFGGKKRDVRSIAKNSSFCVLLAIAGLGTKGEGMGMEITGMSLRPRVPAQA